MRVKDQARRCLRAPGGRRRKAGLLVSLKHLLPTCYLPRRVPLRMLDYTLRSAAWGSLKRRAKAN